MLNEACRVYPRWDGRSSGAYGGEQILSMLVLPITDAYGLSQQANMVTNANKPVDSD